MTSDLVARLLAAIEAKEEKARAALARDLWDQLNETLGRDWPNWLPEDRATVSAYMGDNDPSSVLRRCEQERKTVLAYKGVDDAKGEFGPVDLHDMDKGKWIGLRIAVNGIAASYDITEEET